MFAHLSGTYTVRASAAVGGAVNTDAFANTANHQRGMMFYAVCTSRTAGTCGLTLQQSFDGGSTWVTTSITANITANGTVYLPVDRPVPTYLRVALAPAGGFDGSVAIYARSSDIIVAE